MSAMNGCSELALRRGLVYEGEMNYFRAIHPIPTLTPAHCALIAAHDSSDRPGLLFREDSFDPVMRIRRGRMYRLASSQGQTKLPENVHNDPFGPHVGAAPGWQADAWYDALTPDDIEPACALEGAQVDLGQGVFQTTWRVVDIERIASGHLLWTLRAASLFGVLPHLKDTLGDQAGQPVDAGPVQAALSKLVDAFHVQQPVPIVDVCRETTKVILTAWIGSDAEGKDLGEVIKQIPCDKKAGTKSKCLAHWSALIVNRMHSRGKSAEQEQRMRNGSPIRPLVDPDSETAVHLVGLLLREIGWAQP